MISATAVRCDNHDVISEPIAPSDDSLSMGFDYGPQTRSTRSPAAHRKKMAEELNETAPLASDRLDCSIRACFHTAAPTDLLRVPYHVRVDPNNKDLGDATTLCRLTSSKCGEGVGQVSIPTARKSPKGVCPSSPCRLTLLYE